MTAIKTTEAQFNRFLKSAEAVKDAIPLSSYCRDRGIDLKPAGNKLVALCPLHTEKTGSFTVYPDQHFKCYGCQARGDVLDLHKRLEGLSSVWDAAVSLA